MFFQTNSKSNGEAAAKVKQLCSWWILYEEWAKGSLSRFSK